jgi:transposase InsO family protein
LTEAFPWQEAPQHLIRDRDAVQGGVFLKRVSAMGIRDHPTAPRSPWQNPYAERFIGSLRRECLDSVVVTDEAHLRRILRRYSDYYSRARTHRSLAKDCPLHRAVQAIGAISSSPVLGGLHHVYSRT